MCNHFQKSRENWGGNLRFPQILWKKLTYRSKKLSRPHGCRNIKKIAPWHITIKPLKSKDKKAETKLFSLWGTMIQMITDFSSKTMAVVGQWNGISNVEQERKQWVNSELCIQWKKSLSCKNEGTIKTFSDKQKLSSHPLHKMQKFFKRKGNGTRWKLRYKRGKSAEMRVHVQMFFFF